MSLSLPKKTKIAKWRKDPSTIEKYQFIHHFLPHPHHKTRAKLLSFKALNLYCLLFLSILVGIKAFTKVYPGVLGYASDIRVRELLELTNQKRINIGLTDLVLNPNLTEAAERKARDMFENGYWAHISPEGTEPWDFILEENYDYVYAGENLAKNFTHSKDVVEAWYNSPSHRENLLNKNYAEVGFAVVDGVLDGYETTIVVQMFGKPRDMSYLASSEDQDRILQSLASEQPEAVTSQDPLAGVEVVPIEAVLPALDVSIAVKSISLLFVGFLLILLGLDIWYSRRHSIYKLTGHTVAHIIFLIVSMVGMLFALMPGKIL